MGETATTTSTTGSPVRGIALQLLASVLIAGAAFGVTRVFFPQVLASLTSPPKLVEISPSPVFTCKARRGDVVMATFVVKNVSSRLITLLGAKSVCSCTIAEGLPLKLAPGESGKVVLRVTVGQFDKERIFSKSAELFTNLDGTVPPLVVQVSPIDTSQNL
jgi:hypothetical protein